MQTVHNTKLVDNYKWVHQENILEVLKEYITNLKDFEHLLKSDNYDQLFKQMKDTNAIKTILAGINEKNISNQ